MRVLNCCHLKWTGKEAKLERDGMCSVSTDGELKGGSLDDGTAYAQAEDEYACVWGHHVWGCLGWLG